MSRKVIGLGMLVLTVLAVVAVPGADRPQRRDIRFTDLLPPPENIPPLESVVGPGSVWIDARGQWVVEFDAVEEVLVFAPQEQVGHFGNGNFESDRIQTGHVDLLLEGQRLYVLVINQNDEINDALLQLAADQATQLLEAMRVIQPLVMGEPEPSPPGPAPEATPGERLREVNPEIPKTQGHGGVAEDCTGGSCECTGKCSACCPAGYIPYCTCSGSGTCRCVGIQS